MKKAALTACSDPIPGGRLQEITQVADILREEGLEVVFPSPFWGSPGPGLVQPDPLLFAEDENGPAKVDAPVDSKSKAEGLNSCFRDPETAIIFDVSGGDVANGVLPFLDYEAIRQSSALFCGYSDLTTVINAIIARTAKRAMNYQIRNILYDHAAEQRRYLRENVLAEKIPTEDLAVRFIRGTHMEGKILGGNMRCFLKLAGTPYWPDMRGNILLLESMGGGVYQMMTALEQYRQMGVFEQISGVLLGTFSKMETENLHPTVPDLVMQMLPDNLPVACTRYVGHYSDARAVVLGQETRI